MQLQTPSIPREQILQELANIPESRLAELYQFMCRLKQDSKTAFSYQIKPVRLKPKLANLDNTAEILALCEEESFK